MSQRRAMLPSWLISMVLHLVVVLVLGLTLQLSPPQGVSATRTADVGIVLKHQDSDEPYYENAEEAGGADSTAETAMGGDVGELLSDQPPSDPTSELPAAFAVIGPSALESGGVGSAIGATAGPHARPTIGGKARTGVFGIEGEGYKFVYVFDRSGSMGGSGRSALSAAKAELINSLKSLEQTHQFQIVFYNENTARFNPTGQPNKLCFANERNKTLAERFVLGITADGSTEHEQALVAAIKLQPDVIFFLTDADLPQLGPASLEKIERMARGIQIHAIEFGLGPQRDKNNFLVKLARQNGGKHGYVDVTKLVPVAAPVTRQ